MGDIPLRMTALWPIVHRHQDWSGPFAISVSSLSTAGLFTPTNPQKKVAFAGQQPLHMIEKWAVAKQDGEVAGPKQYAITECHPCPIFALPSSSTATTVTSPMHRTRVIVEAGEFQRNRGRCENETIGLAFRPPW